MLVDHALLISICVQTMQALDWGAFFNASLKLISGIQVYFSSAMVVGIYLLNDLSPPA